MSPSSPHKPRKAAQTTYAKRKRDSSTGRNSGRLSAGGPTADVVDEEELDVIHVSPARPAADRASVNKQNTSPSGSRSDQRTSRMSEDDATLPASRSKRARKEGTSKEASAASQPSLTATSGLMPAAETKTTEQSSRSRSASADAPSSPPRTPPSAKRTDAAADIHTPRTPPRDLSAVYRAVSPSPRAPGRHGRSESIGDAPASTSKAANLPLRGRKRMLSRSESAGSDSSARDTASPTASPAMQGRLASHQGLSTPRRNNASPAFGSPLGSLPPATPSRSAGLSRAYSEILSPSRTIRSGTKTPLGSAHSLPIPLSPCARSASGSQPPSSSVDRPNIRTYGGRSRSYLQEPLEPLKLPTPSKNGDNSAQADPFARPAAPKRTYAEQRQYLQVDVNENEESAGSSDLPGGMHVSLLRAGSLGDLKLPI